MKDCTYRLSLEELLTTRSVALLGLIGADGENSAESGDGTEDTGEAGDGDASGEDDEDDSDDEDAEQPDGKDKKIVALTKEKERHYALRKKAEKDLEEANLRIAKLEKDGIGDGDTATKVTKLEQSVSNLSAQNADLAMENAFLKASTHDWIDADAALRLADLKSVEIDDDGTVHGLEDALDALATKSPYLLKVKEGDDDNPEVKKPRPNRTGSAPKRKVSDEAAAKARDARYLQKYPGLRR